MVKKVQKSSKQSSQSRFLSNAHSNPIFIPMAAVVAIIIITLIALYATDSFSFSSNGATGMVVGMTCQADADCGNPVEVCYSNVCVKKSLVPALDKLTAEKKQVVLQRYKSNYEKSLKPKQVDLSSCTNNPSYDYNNDGFVAKKDYVLFSKILMSKECLSGKTCDLNNDGKYTTADMQLFFNKFTVCFNTCKNGKKELDEDCDGTDGLIEQFCPAGTKGKLSCKSDCTFDTLGCVPFVVPIEICTDSVDNDNNELTDCDDPSCNTNPICKNIDGDLFVDSKDNCPTIPNTDESDYQLDTDKDSVGDACDNCINVPNKDQIDTNNNKKGDACELKCTTNDGWSFYGTQNCGYKQACNDDATKGTLGCCNMEYVPSSGTCDGTLVINQTKNSCTGETITNKFDCSTNKNMFTSCGTKTYNVDWLGQVADCVAPPQKKCTTNDGWSFYGTQNCGYGQACNDDATKGTLGCCNMEYVPSSGTCDGTWIINQTKNSCTGETVTNKLDCSTNKNMFTSCGTKTYNVDWLGQVADCVSNKCKNQWGSYIFFNDKFCGSGASSCNDDSSKGYNGYIGCCHAVPLPGTKPHCEGNVIVNATFNHCTGVENPVWKLDCSTPDWETGTKGVCSVVPKWDSSSNKYVDGASCVANCEPGVDKVVTCKKNWMGITDYYQFTCLLPTADQKWFAGPYWKSDYKLLNGCPAGTTCQNSICTT